VEAALHVHLREYLAKVEHLVSAGRGHVQHPSRQHHLPAWLRPTDGEPRWPVILVMVVAIALQMAIPDTLTMKPWWLLPAVETVLLMILAVANPGRINRERRWLRTASLALVVVASLANIWSAVLLVEGLIKGTEGQNAGPLLAVGAAVWLTNIIVFALWYWEFDRGGPVARAQGARPHPDFLFPQMESPHLTHEHWEPAFADYLYLAFTNATAFSPTDAMPLSRWSKMAMLTQSAVSLVTVALVISRAVGLFK
jgi:uncharacterized membrane protein